MSTGKPHITAMTVRIIGPLSVLRWYIMYDGSMYLGDTPAGAYRTWSMCANRYGTNESAN